MQPTESLQLGLLLEHLTSLYLLYVVRDNRNNRNVYYWDLHSSRCNL